MIEPDARWLASAILWPTALRMATPSPYAQQIGPFGAECNKFGGLPIDVAIIKSWCQ